MLRAREPSSSHWTRQVRKRRHYHCQWSGSTSWPIRCHITWTRKLAAPQIAIALRCPSTCWRWKIISSQLLMLPIRWTSGTTEWTYMTNCPSSLKTFLLRLQVRRTLKGGFLCAASLMVAEAEWLSHCKCEVVWNWTKGIGEHTLQCICVNLEL